MFSCGEGQETLIPGGADRADAKCAGLCRGLGKDLLQYSSIMSILVVKSFEPC